MMQKLTTVVLRHRMLVSVVWVALTVVGALFVGKANGGLTHTIATPGLAGFDANQALIRQVGIDGGEAPLIAVLRLTAGVSLRTPGGQALAARTFAQAADRAGHVGLVDYATSRDVRFISRDGRKTWTPFYVPNPDTGVNKNAEAALAPALAHATPPGAHLTVTRNEALQSTGSGSGAGLSTLTEMLIGAAALIVLAFVYGSSIAVVPLLMALPSILVAFLML
jgi:RND superfamily putative drug exporter